ncbi:MAG: alpha/beta hydrolase [bacterium]|nr:alpha/beta hydrolase [bacterium]
MNNIFKHKLIFISGWGCDETIWSPIVQSLNCNYHSLPWWECLSDSQNENTLYKLLMENSDPVILVGWSLGALIALTAAIQFPNKISGLFLLSPTARMITDEGYTGARTRDIKAMKLSVKISVDKLVNDFFEMCLEPGENDDIKNELIEKSLKIDKSLLTAGLSYLLKTDLRKDLNMINLPVKILHGDNDKIINVSNGSYLNEHLNNSSITFFKNTGHFIFNDNNLENIVQLLINFENKL